MQRPPGAGAQRHALLRAVAAGLIADGAASWGNGTDGPQVQWHFRTGCASVETPALWGDFLYVSSADSREDASHIDAVCAGHCGGRTPGELVWNFGTGAAPAASLGEAAPTVWPPAPGGKTVPAVYCVAGNPPELLVIGADQSGRKEVRPQWRWTAPSGVWAVSSPSVGPDGTVFLGGLRRDGWWGSREAALHAVSYSPAAGAASELWSVPLGDFVTAPVVTPGGVVYAASGAGSGGSLHAFGASRGSSAQQAKLYWVWNVSLGQLLPAVMHDSSAPCYSNGRVFVSAHGQGSSQEPRVLSVIAVAADSGAIVWRRQVASDSVSSLAAISAVAAAGELILVSTNTTAGGSVTALMREQDGAVAWTAAVGPPGELVSCSTPVAAAGAAYVICGSETKQWLWAGDVSSGRQRWLLPLEVGGDPVVACNTPDQLPCGGCRGASGAWNCPPSRPASSPSGAEVYVPGLDGVVYAVAVAPTPAPPPPPAPPPEAGAAAPTGTICAAALGGGFLLVAITVLVVRWRLYPRRRHLFAGKAESRPGSRYQVMRKLGSGAFGAVYLVRRKYDGAEFAMKYIACNSAREKDEALNEWRTVSRLQRGHPNMIQVLETFVDSSEDADDSECSGVDSPAGSATPADALINTVGRAEQERYVCIVMPYFPEGDLRRMIEAHQDTPIPQPVMLSYAGQVASLLSILHGLSPPLVHRDLKPENILLCGRGRTVVVTDFGLARRLNSVYCRTHAGTLAYIAPEMWERRYCTAVDIWALGCILYVMATRRVAKDNSRVLWREAGDEGFQEGIAAELAAAGYGSVLVRLVPLLLAPAASDRPTAEQVVDMLGDYMPPPSRRASLQGISEAAASMETGLSRNPSPPPQCDGEGTAVGGSTQPSPLPSPCGRFGSLSPGHRLPVYPMSPAKLRLPASAPPANLWSVSPQSHQLAAAGAVRSPTAAPSVPHGGFMS